MDKKILVLLFFYLCFVDEGYAQKPSAVRKAQRAYDLANKELASQNHQPALDFLHRATEYDPTFATAYQQLGDIYRKLRNYKKAIESYQSVIEHDPDLTPLTYFGLGESQLFLGQYTEALTNLEQYQRHTQLSGKSKLLVEKYKADCCYALNAPTDSVTLTIEKLEASINTQEDEYFPKLTASNRTIIFTRKTANNESFFSSSFENGRWTEAVLLPGEINSSNFNEGAHCISPDGKYLFFTGCNRPEGMGSCDIYVSKLIEGKWSPPHNLGAPINTKGWEAQPAISADGQTLYFVSNRSGGIGGYDIWKSRLKEDGNWANPENLGPEINTVFDESAPYIHGDNRTLYFASTGWPGYGQYDIFVSQLQDDESWSTPLNMGSPINDHKNQTSLHVSLEGRHGHLSAESESGSLDIYAFEMPSATRPYPVAYITGVVLDADTKEPLDAVVTVTNTDTQEKVFQDVSDYEDGSFLATLPIGSNYALHIQCQGYILESEQYALNEPQYIDEKFTTEILLQPIEKGRTAVLQNIYFEINQHELLPDSFVELRVLADFLNQNKNISIEIGGHTDNTGSANLNMILSRQRAEAVKIFLTAQGIADQRILTHGYGDSRPVAFNESEEGRKMNRRTSFRILTTSY